MARPSLMLSVLALAGAAFAGCAAPDDDADDATDATTTTTPQTTTTTTTPTVPTTPVDTTTATRVVILDAPDRLDAAGDADVCMRVEGSGHVAHVAIHWDTKSHPDSTAFADYTGGAAYPGGKGALISPTGYDLPGVFCAKIPVGSSDVYFRGHALVPTPASGILSAEHVIRAGAPTGVRFTSEIPEVAAAGSDVTLCWAGTISGTFPHTAVHWDTVSHPTSTSFADYKGGASYPDNASAAAAAGYTGGDSWCTSVPMPASGQIYFRAHELDPGASVDAVSPEETIVVASPVSITLAPMEGSHGDALLVCWRVEGAGTVPHTAIHWDVASHPDSTAFADYKGGAAYPGNATSAPVSTLPGPFCTSLEMPEGELYVRAHVLDPDAGREELSAEWRVTHAD